MSGQDKPGPGFDIQAHRGGRALWPENTAEAVAAAARLGANSVEIDVVLTADGVPVVFHDLALSPDIVRTQMGQWVGPGLSIAAMDAGQIGDFDVGRLRPGSRTSFRFRGQTAIDGARIPRLSDLCSLARRLTIRLDIEIKVSPSAAACRAEAVLAAIGEPRAPGTSLRSFDWPLLRLLRARAPDMPLAWLTGSGPNAHPDAVAAHIAQDRWPSWQPVWAPDHRGLRRADIAAAHRAGLAVKPWTVNTSARMRQMIAWGADGLCTDRPDLAISVVSSMMGTQLCQGPACPHSPNHPT